jgi:hypothetical protein
MTTMAEVIEHRKNEDEWGLPIVGRVFPLTSEDDARELLGDMLYRYPFDRQQMNEAMLSIAGGMASKFLNGSRLFGYELRAAP